MNSILNRFEFRLEADKPTELNLYLYSQVRGGLAYDLAKGKFEESKTGASCFSKKLEEYKDCEHINLYINSLGGQIKEGVAIGNILKRHKAKVTCYVDGWACSIASVIAMAADEIVMYNNSLMMIHQASCYCEGNADDMRIAADELDKMTDTAISTYAERCGGKCSREKISEMVKVGTWLTADECLSYGLCDTISTGKQPVDMATMLSDVKRYTMSSVLDGESMDKLIELYKQSTAQQALPAEKSKEEKENAAISAFEKFMKLEVKK